MELDNFLELTMVLRGGRQCDESGVEIIMSRQACVEAADELESLREETNMLRKVNSGLGREAESAEAILSRWVAFYDSVTRSEPFKKIADDSRRWIGTANLQENESTAAWQSIETAPKDGTDILIFGGFISIGNWLSDDTHDWNDGAWWIEGGQVTERNPTHWMPLPPAPNVEVTGLAPGKDDK